MDGDMDGDVSASRKAQSPLATFPKGRIVDLMEEGEQDDAQDSSEGADGEDDDGLEDPTPPGHYGTPEKATSTASTASAAVKAKMMAKWGGTTPARPI